MTEQVSRSLKILCKTKGVIPLDLLILEFKHTNEYVGRRGMTWDAHILWSSSNQVPGSITVACWLCDSGDGTNFSELQCHQPQDGNSCHIMTAE